MSEAKTRQEKFTPWFPPEVKPVHVGDYETKTPDSFGIVPRPWNGQWWGCAYGVAGKSATQNWQWRGLTRPSSKD